MSRREPYEGKSNSGPREGDVPDDIRISVSEARQ